MKILNLWVVPMFLFMSLLQAQNTFRAKIYDKGTLEELIGANAVVKGTTQGAMSNLEGLVEIKNLPNGSVEIEFSFIGYETITRSFELPQKSVAKVYLVQEESTLDEIIVQGTRSNKTIANLPTRVEVLTDEIEEAALMDPSKIAHLLMHSTGIQVQTTSATSNTANVRIQGLDGRYAQILKDGLPLYGGFSGSLSIMQIPPLDLKQVEFIKGGASTLYGGGAISGLINLISKTPENEETVLHVNYSDIGAFDINAFAARKYGPVGFTVLLQRNSHALYDADGDGFSDMPELVKYNFNPKLFFHLGKKTKMEIGGTFMEETRQGGDMSLIRNSLAPSTEHFYRELNEVKRYTTQFQIEHNFNNNEKITLRNSINFFDRVMKIRSNFSDDEYRFEGRQIASFSEFSYFKSWGESVFITGLNYYTDFFAERQQIGATTSRDEGLATIGAFANYTTDFGKKLSMEAGLRTDYVPELKAFVLPRISFLYKYNPHWSSRVGFGMGYRNPSIFNQEAELLGYKDVAAIDYTQKKAEESYGFNADVSYRTVFFEELSVNFNHMFFYTYLDNPLILQGDLNSGWQFVNAQGYTYSAGFETSLRLGYKDWMLFAGYTYTDAQNVFNGERMVLPLTPVHSLKTDLMYEIKDKWRIGADAEFKGPQTTMDLETGFTREVPTFWVFGLMVERTFKKKYSVYINAENFLDARQTRFENLASGPFGTPQFTEVWAPLDGRFFNAGFRVKF